MPVSKLFTPEINFMASLFKVLGQEARLSILKYLLDHTTATNKELVEFLGLTQSTVSQHMVLLKNANLVVCTMINNAQYYSLHPDVLATMENLANVVNFQPQNI